MFGEKVTESSPIDRRSSKSPRTARTALQWVAGAGFVVGFSARLVDRKIGLVRKDVFILLLVSVASNLIVLEREAVGILLSIFRDWFILYLISILMVSRLSGVLVAPVRK